MKLHKKLNSWRICRMICTSMMLGLRNLISQVTVRGRNTLIWFPYVILEMQCHVDVPGPRTDISEVELVKALLERYRLTVILT
jgi:hypothetical protein